MTLLRKSRMVLLVLLLSVFFLSGCSTLPKPGPDTVPAIRQQADLVPEGTQLDVEVYDPIEGFNRGAYRFNYYFDKYLLLPVVSVYKFIMPDYAEDRVSNFVDNIFEFNNFTNNLLQLKFKETGVTLSRFVINTTVGVAGLWDPATHWASIGKKRTSGKPLGITVSATARTLFFLSSARPTCVTQQAWSPMLSPFRLPALRPGWMMMRQLWFSPS